MKSFIKMLIFSVCVICKGLTEELPEAILSPRRRVFSGVRRGLCRSPENETNILLPTQLKIVTNEFLSIGEFTNCIGPKYDIIWTKVWNHFELFDHFTPGKQTVKQRRKWWGILLAKWQIHHFRYFWPSRVVEVNEWKQTGYIYICKSYLRILKTDW